MRLFWLELKRVLRTRSTIVILAIALVLSIMMAWLPVSYIKLTLPDGNGGETKVTGMQALAEAKERRSEYSGEITPEMMEKALAQYQDTVEQYGDPYEEEFPLEVDVEQLFPVTHLTRRLVEVYANENGMAPEVADLTQEDAARFYEQCTVHIGDLMKLEQSKYPDAQRQAKELYSKVEQPFYYYPGYTTDALEYVGMYVFLLVFFCTLIAAPIFSSEYQTGSDDILRCTKHGRIRLAVTKIATALLLFVVTFAVCMTIFTVVSNSLFGWECRQTSLQIISSAATLVNLTLGGAQNWITGMGLLSLLATASFTLFLSSVCCSNVKALGLSLGFLVGPSIFYMLTNSQLIAWLRCIMPSGAVGLMNSFTYTITGFEFLHIGQKCFWPPVVMFVAELIAIPLFLVLTVRCYQKHISR
ncbi:MAG: ABC transporter permease subunit [Eubacteriales bacterium]|nr:ABC transporter permease subunit [Eubacteriales bacterium]